MARVTTSVRVARTKLIEILEAKVKESEDGREKLFKDSLATEIKRVKNEIKKSETFLKELEKIKTPEDVPERHYWWHRNKNSNLDLEKQVKLLKLSEQEELLVSPTSNLYSYL